MDIAGGWRSESGVLIEHGLTTEDRALATPMNDS